MKRKLFFPIIITLSTIVVVAGFFWGLHAYVTDRNFQTTDYALKMSSSCKLRPSITDILHGPPCTTRSSKGTSPKLPSL